MRNLREFLLGMDDTPQYLFDLGEPQLQTEAVARWWTERWLSRRVWNEEALARVARHTLVRPVRHGARVVLPSLEEKQQRLFEDLE